MEYKKKSQTANSINKHLRFLLTALSIWGTTCFNLVVAQEKPGYKTVVAGKEYKKSSFGKKMWGKHYRNEWTTPVSVKIAMLDTLAGGLTAYEIGGSRQTKSVKLHDKDNREYVLRSIDKSYTNAIPEIAHGSFIEHIANDQVSIAHPYAALTIAPMAEAAKIYHTNPAIYYIPKQTALGKFNDEIGDNLYLLERRPDENWKTAENFGNPSDIKSTDKLLEKLLKDNDNQVDQQAFARARLFDMLIGDWGRHEDQWRWAEFKSDGKTIYKPIPRDRDQAYTMFDGVLLNALKGLAAPHLQSFSDNLVHIDKFNYPARNLDRHLLNEVTLQEWKDIATDMQQSITDSVIDYSMKQLPPEVYGFSAASLASNLKSRRGHLGEYAEAFYKVLAKSVDITGTSDRELFEVKRINDDATQVNIYKITKSGNTKDKPYYSRTFYKSETFEVRLYGIDGEDRYELTGNTNKGISVRLIGGNDKDIYNDASHVKGIGHKTVIYDSPGNSITNTSETSVHLSRNTAIHEYKYDAYRFDKKGFKPLLLYNNDDRIYVGLSYVVTRNKWRKEPYGFKQYFDVKYSLSQNALSFTYKSTFKKLIGSWDGVFYANYDFVRWTNFFGLGNDTKLNTNDRNYNRIRSRAYRGNIGVERIFDKYKKLYMNGFIQGIDIINDTDRYVAKSPYVNTANVYKNNLFTGANVGFVYQKLNDSILPVKGISLLVNANYTFNLQNSNKNFARVGTDVYFYQPFTKNLGVMLRGGAYTITGTPDFYQYNSIGSSETMRGYRRDRFYGNTSVYNQNELRWISNVHSYIYNGKIGFFALYDLGRVWLKNESSNTLHHAYGGGIILSPYNKITGSISYAISPEENNFHLRLFKVF